MIKASHAIPKRIHRDTVFLYHSGYLREGSIPREEARSEDEVLGKSGPWFHNRNGQTWCDTMNRIWEVQTGLRLPARWSPP